MLNQLSLSKTFPLSSATSTFLGASLLAAATVLSAANFANAATFNFSFSNVEGAVNGTVEGTIELPDGDGTNLAATSVIVTSAPADLGYTTPFDVLANFPIVLANNFTVTGGAIDAAASIFAAQTPTEALTLNLPSFGSLLNLPGTADASSGVVDASNSTLTYTGPAAIPEPLTLLGVATATGFATFFKRKSNWKQKGNSNKA